MILYKCVAWMPNAGTDDRGKARPYETFYMQVWGRPMDIGGKSLMIFNTFDGALYYSTHRVPAKVLITIETVDEGKKKKRDITKHHTYADDLVTVCPHCQDMMKEVKKLKQALEEIDDDQDDDDQILSVDSEETDQ